MIGAIGALRRRQVSAAAPGPPWRLRGVPVCASTEILLDRWLADAPDLAGDRALPSPLAVIARRQRHGHGQRGRPWSSPPGGVWLSAALPWPAQAGQAASLALAVAVGLCLRLEHRGLPVRIKWPNDLVLPVEAGGEGRVLKLAGLLPRLRLRGGACRWARIGVGLNVANPVPPGAVALATLLGRGRAEPLHWCGEVLASLDWAMAWAGSREAVRGQAERRLLLPAGPIRLEGEEWQPAGLTADGGLRLVHGTRDRVLQREFGAG
ncbi:biotin--[acetyl-CoA-carboxylase] ligase [Synechococcus sp. CCY 9618]|uniref:biotin--[acetyl-CoA-carboxylase] ligase n=1 Tax=Synechococcus sp. CCY 9618 TaxID=2815602 RepID=UPI0020B29530|nr:biotin--[acetyl-CoA-carboxylase] ligase [Synechococcus sp. CCY 9618]